MCVFVCVCVCVCACVCVCKRVHVFVVQSVTVEPRIKTINLFEVDFYCCQYTFNKAGYTATPVTCGWAWAVIEKVTRAFGLEQ